MFVVAFDLLPNLSEYQSAFVLRIFFWRLPPIVWESSRLSRFPPPELPLSAHIKVNRANCVTSITPICKYLYFFRVPPPDLPFSALSTIQWVPLSAHLKVDRIKVIANLVIQKLSRVFSKLFQVVLPCCPWVPKLCQSVIHAVSKRYQVVTKLSKMVPKCCPCSSPVVQVAIYATTWPRNLSECL